MRIRSSHLAFIAGLLVPVIVSAGIIVFIFRGDLSHFFQSPPTPPHEGFLAANDGRALVYPSAKVNLTVPAHWKVKDPQKYTVFLEPDFVGTACEMRVGFGPNTTGGSATAYLEQYDLGPRVGTDVYGDEKWQGMVKVSGWEGAGFWWKSKNLTRYREVYLPFGAQLITFFSKEDLTKLGTAGSNCFADFDVLVNSFSQ